MLSEKDSRFYIGQTQDLNKRIKTHNSGQNKSTKHRIPFRLYSSLEVESRSDAIKIERILKNLKSRKRIDNWIMKRSEAKGSSSEK